MADEPIAVLLHASLLGRTDIIQHAISSLRANGTRTPDEISAIISSGRGPTDDVTALHIAARHGHADAVRALLNAGADPSIVPKYAQDDSPVLELLGKTPYEVANEATLQAFHVYLFEQIAMGNIHKIEKLLEGGIPLDILDGSKLDDSTLHWAVSFNNIEVVRILCDHGIDVNIRNTEGQTPLHIACKNDNNALVELLLQHGGNAEEKDSCDRTPGEVLKTENTEILHMLQTVKPIEKPKKSYLQTDVSESPASHGADMSEEEREKEKQKESSDEQQPSLLVLWPPPQRQYQSTSPSSTFELSSTSYVVVSAASTQVDIYPFLSWSGALEAFDRLGLQVQVKRSGRNCTMRLMIDPEICPGRHRFELSIRSHGIVLLASDLFGLTYGVHSLVQILQMHSRIVMQENETRVLVPCVSITDWPDTPNRAILWTFKQQLRTSSLVMRRVVEVLSRVRVNQLFLVLDTERQMRDEGREDDIQNDSLSDSSRLSSLDEVCHRCGVDLIPTIVITSTNKYPVLEQLHNLSSTVMCVNLQLEKPLESTDDVFQIFLSDCQSVLIRTLNMLLETGCHSVLLLSPNWLRYALCPLRIAISLGLAAKEIENDVFCPSRIVCPTLLGHSKFLNTLIDTVDEAHRHGSSTIVMPSMSSSNFVYPIFTILFQCFLFGGVTWNHERVLDMLYHSSVDDGIDFDLLVETVSSILLPDQSDRDSQTISVLLDMFTGSCAVEKPQKSSNIVSSDTPVAETDRLKTEEFLWSVMTGDISVLEACTPSRETLHECLRQYRRVLQSARWKIKTISHQSDKSNGGEGMLTNDDPQFDLLSDELFCVVHLMSILCRSMILAYNVVEKEQIKAKQTVCLQNIPLGDLISELNAGVNSDLANALLEAMEYCSSIWRRRYDSLVFPTPSGAVSLHCSERAHDAVKALRNRFLLQEEIIIPASEIFRKISEKLPIITNDVLSKIFLRP